MGAISALGQVASGAMGAFGQIQQGQAAAGAAKFNAQIAKENAAQERQNAAIVGQAGAEQAAQASMRGKEQAGSFAANKGAGGVQMNTGSSQQTGQSIADLTQLDAMTVRSNAVKQAYGHEIQAVNKQAEASLDLEQAKEDIQSSQIGAATTFLSGASTGAANYAQFQMAGGNSFGFNDASTVASAESDFGATAAAAG